jgi:lipopolysaccharide transport system ATP-binding protein
VRGKEDPYLKIGEVNDRTQKGTSEFVWALRDINFEVQKGEVLGIIGRNGAGKSTLLKILSSTTSPTLGEIRIKGKIASLLEVGTGFHPDLTGRDNIYLNGAILGMTKREITSKFDEIVQFSGVEKYIDTPVKRYSSGMYVRLAFGVAAHLEPDILIVDEVLAVGDAEFQKKCLGKMKEVSVNEGRTVLFVSHQMGAISQLCTNGIVLKNGTIAMIGPIKDAINEYLKKDNTGDPAGYVNTKNTGKQTYFKKITTYNQDHVVTEDFGFDEDIFILCEFEIGKLEKNVLLGVTILDKYGYWVSTAHLVIANEDGSDTSKEFKIKIPKGILAPNSYSFRIALFKPHVILYDLVDPVCPIRIIDTGSKMAHYEGMDYGNIIMDVQFEQV